MSFPYTIQPGDTMKKIARKFGFADWREIYNHPDNAGFRAKRPSPDKIYKGDVIQIPSNMLRRFVSGGPLNTASFAGGTAPVVTYPPPHLIELGHRPKSAGRPFYYMWHLLCAAWRYSIAKPYLPNLPDGIMAPIQHLITKEVMIALFWEETFFNNIIQYKGPAIGFAQTEPGGFWRFKQRNKLLYIPKLSDSNIRLRTCYVMLRGSRIRTKCISRDKKYHKRFTDFLSVIVSLAYMRYIYEDARSRGKRINRRSSYLSFYGGRPTNDPVLLGILNCAAALERNGPPRSMSDDQIMNDLKLAKYFNKNDSAFRTKLFPYRIPNQSIPYFC